MEIRSTNGLQRVTRSVSGRIGVAIFLAGFVFASQPAIAQSLLERPSSPPQSDSTTPAQTSPDRVGLKQVVKIVIEPGTNRIMLIGSKEDVAVVVRTLNSIKKRMKTVADPTVTEKVVLESQLAETVASIMTSSLAVHDPGGPQVKINAVHFPEAILISGPASAVKRAKKLLATIDRYEGL